MDGVGPGSVLGDRYVLRRRLAEARQASRWTADDQTLDRVVVVQVLHRGHPHAAAVLDAARRAAGIDDPRLNRVLDVGRDPLAYVVTEFVGDTTLSSRLSGGPLPAEAVRALMGEVSLALEHARRRGLHHLRLTPDDVHFADEHTVKVAGIAVHAAMAGADASSDPDADAATDTRAVVALGYAGLTGHWPLRGRTTLPPAPMVAGAPAPPSEIVSGVPADLDTLCAQAFAGAGAPRTPGELAAQIAPWGRGRSPGPTPPSVAATPPPGTPRAVPPRPSDDTIVLPSEPVPAPAGGRRPARTTATRSVAAPIAARPATAKAAEPTAPPAKPPPTARRTDTPASRPAPRPAGRPAAAAPEAVNGRPDAPSATSSRPALKAAAAAAAVKTAATKVTATPAAAAVKAAATKVTAATAAAVRQPRFIPDEPRARQAPDGPGGLFEDDALGAGPVDGREPPAPLLPPVPVSRPPQNQTRTVLLLVGGFLAVFSLLAFFGLRGLGEKALVALPDRTTTPSATATAPTSSATAPSATASPTATPPPRPVQIQAASGFDPLGDNAEKDSLAERAFDNDPSSAWTSENYRTENFGGLKEGVGLRLDLGAPTKVSRVSVNVGSGTSALQLRTVAGDGDALDGSQVVAESAQATGTVTLTPQSPVTARYLVLWFTSPAQTDGGYRVEVREVSAR